MEETKLKTAEDIRKEIFEMVNKMAKNHVSDIMLSTGDLANWSLKIKEDIEALTDTRHSGGVPIIKIIKTVREVAFYQEPKTQIFYLDLNKLHKELEKVMGHAADVPTERLCVFCNEPCEDVLTERGWAEVPYNKGLHFDCAGKVVGIVDVPGEEEINKWAKSISASLPIDPSDCLIENAFELERLKLYVNGRIEGAKWMKAQTKPITPELTDEEPYFGWCDVKGCDNEGANGGNCWNDTGYWTVCSKHASDYRSGKPQPKMKQSAIDRENSRNKITGCLP